MRNIVHWNLCNGNCDSHECSYLHRFFNVKKYVSIAYKELVIKQKKNEEIMSDNIYELHDRWKKYFSDDSI